jgi:cell division protein FtsQ
MVAVVRGGARSGAKPRPRGPAVYANPPRKARMSKAVKAPKPPKSPRSAAGPYQPAKLRAAANVIAPRHAVAAAAAVLCLALIITAVTGDRPQRIAGALRGGIAGDLALVGFKVEKVHVQGVDETAQKDILRATGLYKGAPIFGEDLDTLRQRVETVGWVKEARIVRLLPDTLVVAVTPRPTLAIWQHNGVAHVIDDNGQLIIEADPGRFPDLPLVVGDGANEASGAILPVLRTRPHLMERLEALVRVDGRRWDLRLKDGSLIQLPAVGEDSALIQLDQLDQRSRVLELGFERIDLRDPETIAVRPRAEAATPRTVAAAD